MNRKLFTAINFFIAIATVTAIIVTLIIGSRASRLDELGVPYWAHVVTFTILSNIFLGIVALVSGVISLVKHDEPLPRALKTWYLVAVSAGILTFLTVVLFLGPLRVARGKNYLDLLAETMFFLHFFDPVLAAVTLVFFPETTKITLKSRLLATLPIVIYAIPYVIFVILLKIWPDFYGVTFGGRYYLTPLVFLVFWVVIFAIASLLAFLHNKRLQKTPKIC